MDIDRSFDGGEPALRTYIDGLHRCILQLEQELDTESDNHQQTRQSQAPLHREVQSLTQRLQRISWPEPQLVAQLRSEIHSLENRLRQEESVRFQLSIELARSISRETLQRFLLGPTILHRHRQMPRATRQNPGANHPQQPAANPPQPPPPTFEELCATEQLAPPTTKAAAKKYLQDHAVVLPVAPDTWIHTASVLRWAQHHCDRPDDWEALPVAMHQDLAALYRVRKPSPNTSWALLPCRAVALNYDQPPANVAGPSNVAGSSANGPIARTRPAAASAHWQPAAAGGSPASAGPIIVHDNTGPADSSLNPMELRAALMTALPTDIFSVLSFMERWNGDKRCKYAKTFSKGLDTNFFCNAEDATWGHKLNLVPASSSLLAPARDGVTLALAGRWRRPDLADFQAHTEYNTQTTEFVRRWTEACSYFSSDQQPPATTIALLKTSVMTIFAARA